MRKLIAAGVDLSEFQGVPYTASRHPNSESIQGFLAHKERGANCELFALGVLWVAGFYAEAKRSIELWHDTDFTTEVSEGPYKIFDIFFFLPKGIDPHRVAKDVLRGADREDPNDLKKFHLGVFLGMITQYNFSCCILHLPKPGPSVLWPFEDFEKSEKEYWLFKVKRPIIRRIGRSYQR